MRVGSLIWIRKEALQAVIARRVEIYCPSRAYRGSLLARTDESNKATIPIVRQLTNLLLIFDRTMFGNCEFFPDLLEHCLNNNTRGRPNKLLL